jgi:hypothetical protein
MNVLAFEADDTQIEGIRHVVCDRVGARLTVATSFDHVLHALREDTPDLVLLPALVSPSQENALVESLRSLSHASHVQTLLTPVLPAREPAAPQGWRRWTRRASAAPATAAETEEFAGRVHWALERAKDKRAHANDARHELLPPPEPPVDSALSAADAADECDGLLSESAVVESATESLVTRLVEPVMLAVEQTPVVEASPSLLQLLDGYSDQRVAAPEDLELDDATSRLLRKLSRPEARHADPHDRRQYRRFTASELPGLRSARIKFGPDVALVDVSAGGVLLETNARLQPESEALLELFGSARQTIVPFRVLRCRIAALDGSPKYLGACAFKEPLDLDELAWASTEMSALDARVPALTLVPARIAVRNAW